MRDRADSVVVIYVNPVPHIFASAVYRDWLVCKTAGNDPRDELFCILVGAKIIGAIRDDDWQAVGVVPGPCQVIRGCL